jgi:hypothetical protein
MGGHNTGVIQSKNIPSVVLQVGTIGITIVFVMKQILQTVTVVQVYNSIILSLMNRPDLQQRQSVIMVNVQAHYNRQNILPFGALSNVNNCLHHNVIGGVENARQQKNTEILGPGLIIIQITILSQAELTPLRLLLHLQGGEIAQLGIGNPRKTSVVKANQYGTITIRVPIRAE